MKLIKYSKVSQIFKSKKNSSDKIGGFSKEISTCRCGLPNDKFCMLDFLPQLETIGRQKRHYLRTPLNICSLYSTSFSSQAPSATASTTILYSKERRLPEPEVQYDPAGSVNFNKITSLEKVKQHKNSRKTIFLERVGKEKRDKCLPTSWSSSSLLPPPSKQHQNKPLASLKTNLFMKGKLPSYYSLDSFEDSLESNSLITTGANWSSTNPLKTHKTFGLYPIISSNSLGSMITKKNKFSNKQIIGSFQNGWCQHPTAARCPVKESESRYPNPLIGSPLAFSQRVAEIAALEYDTVRWEKNRKLRKRFKQDRDS